MSLIGELYINHQTKGYLIHGQPFSLQFDFAKTKWGVVFYRPGAMSSNFHKTRQYKPGSSFWGANTSLFRFFRIIRGKGSIALISNAYYPKLTFVLFSSYINPISKRFSLPLKIHFINPLDIDTKHHFHVSKKEISLTIAEASTPDFSVSINIHQSQIQIAPLSLKTEEIPANMPNLRPIYAN